MFSEGDIRSSHTQMTEDLAANQFSLSSPLCVTIPHLQMSPCFQLSLSSGSESLRLIPNPRDTDPELSRAFFTLVLSCLCSLSSAIQH